MFLILAKNEELIILEKRQRKLIVKQNFNIVDSDEYVSENYKSLSDFTDSEDEWGAINHPKNKVKQSLQTPSKLLPILEKQVSEAEKMLKCGPSNMFDTNQSDKYNQHDETLVRSKNKSFLKEKDSKSMAQGNIYYDLLLYLNTLLKLRSVPGGILNFCQIKSLASLTAKPKQPTKVLILNRVWKQHIISSAEVH